MFIENDSNDNFEYYQRKRNGLLLKLKLYLPRYLTSYLIKFKGFRFIKQYYESLIRHLKLRNLINNITLITLADSEYLLADNDIVQCIDESILNFKKNCESKELKFENKIIELFGKNIHLEKSNSQQVDLLMFYPPNIYHNDIKYELIKNYNPKYVLGEFEDFITDEEMIRHISNYLFLIKRRRNNLIENLICYERNLLFV